MSDDRDSNDNPMTSDSLSPYASPSDEPGKQIGSGLAIAALILPVVAGSALFFVTSPVPSLLLSGGTVVTTAILLTIDAYRRRRTDRFGRQLDSPGLLFLAMLLLWIVAYPLAYFGRQRYGDPKLGIPSIAVAIYFAIGPLAYSFVQPLEVPLCTDPMVIDIVEQSLRSAPAGDTIRSIDSHREIRYDNDQQIRYGTCVVHSDDGTIELGYRVEWQNRDTGQFVVTCDPLPLALPVADSQEVVELLARVVADSDIGVSVESIKDHRQIRYDSSEEVRYCECVVETAEGPRDIRYIVEWLDRESAYFGVRIPPSELPSCTDPEVIKVLEQVIRSTPLGSLVRTIEDHRELSFDRETNVRRGECLVRLPNEVVRVPFIVEWDDPERGTFRVQTLDE